MVSIKQISNRASRIRRCAQGLLVYAFATAIASSITYRASAQTFAEWFQQNKTQKKYLTDQIAALQVYASYLKTGYQLANEGLGSIGKSVKNEFALHQDYYHSLTDVNQIVYQDPRVKQITVWQAAVCRCVTTLKRVSGLTTAEQQYVGSVSSAILRDCDKQLSELQSVITGGQIQMTDEERLLAIERIFGDMRDDYCFTETFSSQVQLLVLNRSRTQRSGQIEKQIYGIK